MSAKDLQKSLEHANISVDKSTARKTLNKNGVHWRTLLLKKKHCCTSEVCKSAHGCSTVLVAKCSVDRLTVQLFGRNTQHYVWKEKGTSKPHPNCKVWWREHHDLGLLCCLRAWTACYHRRINEFPSLSRHFTGEC